MGRDLRGRNATSPEGRDLDLNVWSWEILTKFVWMFAPTRRRCARIGRQTTARA